MQLFACFLKRGLGSISGAKGEIPRWCLQWPPVMSRSRSCFGDTYLEQESSESVGNLIAFSMSFNVFGVASSPHAHGAFRFSLILHTHAHICNLFSNRFSSIRMLWAAIVGV